MFSAISITLIAATAVTVLILMVFFWKVVMHYKQKAASFEKIFQLVERSQDIIYHFEIKPDFEYKYLSPAIEKVLGADLIEESKKNPLIAFDRIHPDDYNILLRKISGKLDYTKPVRQRWKNDEGIYICFEEFVTPIYENGELTAVQGIIRNVDDKVALQKELEYKATHDSLTDLFNREFFESLMQKYNDCEDISTGMIICDLNNLKLINDRYGHKMGDRLIVETAGILKKVSADHISVSRIGGDEFAILIEHCSPGSPDELTHLLQSTIHSFNQNSTEFKLSMAMGNAHSESSIGRMEELFKQADQRMYREKHHHNMARPSIN
ncbi:sensor domain-containing diguanylate cyclase [Bacillus sp. Marseille-Q1617]|uniref:sensor domain-containing diguanylate cyclase n=1 Tax=Bacillus sp. Marseille-Q1617 TaxID=2736887 RepID=UPI00158F3CB2|nr:sensor domain-containing diguanylate cyclase [Bacillus sp. Marseille-Q1617]